MVNTRKKFGGNELALAGAVKEVVTCWRSSPLNKSDQVISNPEARTATGACTWSGPQATSYKLQAPGVKLSSIRRQASSPRQQASSVKPQAASSLILEPRYMDIGEVLGVQASTMMTALEIAFPCLLPSLLASVNLDKNSCRSLTFIIFLSSILIVESLH